MTRVVVSVGTDHHPYQRMLDWIAAAQAQLPIDVLVQRGATPERPGVPSVDYVGADELAALMRDADAVVCHGGPGTISAAIRCGHRPIVMARNPALGEHIDDHQMRYVAKLGRDGVIDAVDDLDTLIALLSAPRDRRTDVDPDADRRRAVEEFGVLVGQLVTGQLPKRRWRDRFLLRREP